MATNLRQKGKYAEGLVKKELARLSLQQSFAFYRLPDARSGSFTPTLSDFIVESKGVTTLLEVKEVNHEYRLPRPNFKLENRNRMRMFEMAGMNSLILVYFTPVKLWRAERLIYFTGDETGSWDMRDSQPILLSSALAVGL